MKKTITLISTMFACMVMQAQTTLTIETTPGELKNVMTQEQIQSVEDLTLTGGMNKEDFYFIRDRLMTLKNLNLKLTTVDTIPKNALLNRKLSIIILPIQIGYIEENAFKSLENEYTTIYLTGPYPKRGAYIFDYDDYGPKMSFQISKDNIYCKKVFNNSILSSDGKVLYEADNEMILSFEEGLEIIESYAFVDAMVKSFRFPSSLRLIKENAFYNLEWLYITSYYYETPIITLESSTPPILEKNAFVMGHTGVEIGSNLIVPFGSIKKYRKADPQWNNIFYIEESEPGEYLEIENIKPGGIKKYTKDIVSLYIKNGKIGKEDFYYIRDSLIHLKKLNLRWTEIDTIPAAAFLSKNIQKVILPHYLKYIGENAFVGMGNSEIYLTGPYPKRAARIADKPLLLYDNNEDCKINDNGTFSSDGKTLYEATPGAAIMDFEEGLETIETHAFVDSKVLEYRFPSSLKQINENAFYNIEWIYNTRNGGLDPTIIMKAELPPVLEQNAFIMSTQDGYYPLSVPKGCVESYRNADPQWKIFRIREGNQPQGIDSVSNPNLSIIRNGNSWILNGEKNISKIEVFGTIGALIFSSKCNDTQVEIPMGKTNEVLYARVLYVDNTTEVIKLIK